MKRFRPEITEEEVSFIITQIDDDNSGKISYDGKLSFDGLHYINIIMCVLTHL